MSTSANDMDDVILARFINVKHSGSYNRGNSITTQRTLFGFGRAVGCEDTVHGPVALNIPQYKVKI